MAFESENEGEALSIRDELSAALTADDATQSAQGGQGAQPVIEQQPQETADQAAARARDEAGRFAKSGEQGQNNTTNPTPLAGGEPAAQAIAPPAAWSAAAKADFAKLPPHIQQEVAKREKDWNDGLAQRQQKDERFNRLDSLLAPRRERFALAGVDEFQAVQALFAAQDLLERRPLEGLAYLARQYGVNLASLAQGQNGQQAVQQPPMPPAFQQLAQQVSTLQNAIAQQQQSAAQQVQSQYVSQVQAFRTDPKNIYFENVKGDMAALIQSGQATDLQTAYDKATWAHPEIRPLLLKAQQDQSASQAQQAARTKASAARHAAGSVTGSPAPGSSPAQGQASASIREALSSAWDDVS